MLGVNRAAELRADAEGAGVKSGTVKPSATLGAGAGVARTPSGELGRINMGTAGVVGSTTKRNGATSSVDVGAAVTAMFGTTLGDGNLVAEVGRVLGDRLTGGGLGLVVLLETPNTVAVVAVGVDGIPGPKGDDEATEIGLLTGKGDKGTATGTGGNLSEAPVGPALNDPVDAANGLVTKRLAWVRRSKSSTLRLPVVPGDGAPAADATGSLSRADMTRDWLSSGVGLCEIHVTTTKKSRLGHG
jgi:hypothetical protein